MVRLFLQQQRDWNSHSTTSMNSVGNVIVPTSTSANTATTHSRPQYTTATTPPPTFETSPNTSTLPHIRNLYKHSTANPNITKSVSNWGSLRKPPAWKVRNTG